MNTILVTGGAGFIGSNFVRWILRHHDYNVVNFDKLTYAGNLDNLLDVEGDPRYRFVRGDICDAAAVEEAIREADSVVNFAAESHVDRSLMDPGAFIRTDVYGVFVLLEAARRRGVERFVHVSTDEVYGPRFPEDPGRESDPLTPANPYAASKAGGEMLCFAYQRTYGLPVLVTRSRNNVGPYQHPEKAVPLFVTNALDGQPLPVYGEGLQVRDRLYVEDNCEAIDLVLHRGDAGEAYNIGADNERPNIEVVETILALLEKPESLIRFVEDRQGHDARYCIDTSKIRALGWLPRHDFDAAMSKTVAWYRENRWWWEKVKSGDYADYYQRQYGERLARGRTPSTGSGRGPSTSSGRSA